MTAQELTKETAVTLALTRSGEVYGLGKIGEVVTYEELVSRMVSRVDNPDKQYPGFGIDDVGYSITSRQMIVYTGTFGTIVAEVPR